MGRKNRLVNISKRDVSNSIKVLKLIESNYSKIERLNKLYADEVLPLKVVDKDLIKKGFIVKEKHLNQYSLNTAQIKIISAAIQLLKI